MKFYNFLNESGVGSINKAIQRDCGTYLNFIKRINDHVFTRSMEPSTLKNKKFGTKDVRKNRIPKGMDPMTFIKLNEWLQANGHNRRDKSVSAGAKADVLFGERFYFFPIGKFSYSWLESADMNIEDAKTGWYPDAPRLYFENPEFDTTYGDALKKPFADYFHTDEGISTAYKNNFEVWFNCSSYYYVSTEYYRWDNVSKEIIRR